MDYSAWRGRDGSQAECTEVGVGQGHAEGGAAADPPRAVRASGGLSRQVLADPAASQFREAGASALPLFPGDAAQPSPDPLVKLANTDGVWQKPK